MHRQPLAPPAYYIKSSSELQVFTGTSVNKLCSLIPDAPHKQCELDSISTWLFKECATDLAPFLMDMLNKSLCSGELLMALKKSIVKPALKKSIVKPILKKPNLDADDLALYHPVSNLPFISKLLEKIVASDCRQTWMITNCFLVTSRRIGAFVLRKQHLLRVLSDLTSAMESGKLALLTLLDMSAAFDTVDHEILLRRLIATYAIRNGAFMWITSYLSDRTEKVQVGSGPATIHYVHWWAGAYNKFSLIIILLLRRRLPALILL